MTEVTKLRKFETGAIRDKEEGKLDYESFLSPLVMKAFATYMHFNRKLPDGTLRDGDNWQKGIPMDAYMKSGWRHFMDWWMWHRKFHIKEGIVWALCGVIFNAQGYLHEILKNDPSLIESALEEHEKERNY